jgi:RNA polymerase sigma factor (sigma-70 family)
MKTRESHHNGADWLGKLRVRFLEIAARRVNESDVEDVVQEAMRIVVEKRIGRDDGKINDLPPLAWCFQVLRNAIGNHYRREDTRRRRFSAQTSDGETNGSIPARFAEALDSQETLKMIQDALVEMQNKDKNCGRYLSRLVDNTQPRDVAAEEGLDPAIFYRRLYRCRQKLRGLLLARGVDL